MVLSDGQGPENHRQNPGHPRLRHGGNDGDDGGNDHVHVHRRNDRDHDRGHGHGHDHAHSHRCDLKA